MRHLIRFLAPAAARSLAVQLVLIGLLGSGLVHGAVLVVDDLTDTAAAHDIAPGDGFCASSDGTCTLRSAVEEANALGGRHTVCLPHGTVELMQDTLLVGTGPAVVLTIQGVGELSTIDGRNSRRPFDVSASAELHLVQLHLTRGRATSGGCVRALGPLVLDRAVVSACSCTASGGAVASAARLVIRDSELIGNVAGVSGGAMDASGSTLIERSHFSGNSTEGSGGALSLLGAVEIRDSVLVGNHAGTEGGALDVAGATTTVLLDRTTLADNGSSDLGGAVSNRGALRLVNVTLGSNHADHYGGALVTSPGSSTELEHTTVNASTAGAGAADALYWQGGRVTARSSVFAGHTESCSDDVIVSLGHNVEDGSTCGFTHASDQVNVDVLFGPSHTHGGLVPVLEPVETSNPLLDAGEATVRYDARGYGRPAGAAADVGAFEAGAVPSLLFADGLESGMAAGWSAVVGEIVMDDGFGSGMAIRWEVVGGAP